MYLVFVHSIWSTDKHFQKCSQITGGSLCLHNSEWFLFSLYTFFWFRNAELFSPKYTKLFAAQKFVLSIHNRRRIDERNLYTQWVELRLENAHNCFYFSVISSTCKVWLNRCVINMLVLYMVCAWDGRCILPWNSIHWVCRLLYFTLSHILSLSIAFDLCVRCTVCICVIGIVRRLCTCIDTILFFHFGVYTDSQSEWAREREREMDNLSSSVCDANKI